MISFVGGLVALLLLMGSQNAMAQRVSGAVFTSEAPTVDPKVCTGVDINIYALKDEVFIDGGPTKVGAAGLPSGDFYVQVTEPNGTLLGTSIGGASGDTPVNVNLMGEFSDCFALSDILVTASDSMVAGYDDTSNPGCEYKVWVSQNMDFPPSESKTDNFKVPCDAGGGGCGGGGGGDPLPPPQ